MNAWTLNKRWFLISVTAIFSATFLGWVISESGVLGLGALAALPFAAGVFYLVFKHPSNGLFITLLASFFAVGIARYLPGPLGLSVDFFLALTILSAVLSPKVTPKIEHLNNLLVYFTIFWFGYCLLQIINPEAVSTVAWFYAVRGVALYMIFTVILALLYLDNYKYLNYFFYFIFGATLITCLWGLKQKFIGLDSAEWAWLNSGPKRTHVLRGKLRIFSVYSDAGQMGAHMGHMLVCAIVLLFGPFSLNKKLLLGLIALLSFYLMIISGTRGALFVPAAGILAFLFMIKNFRLLILGLLFLGTIYAGLRYTTILNDVYEVRRMRSALNPEDASLQVRLANQKKYKEYLKTRPFGGGIGTAGSWGIRFSPGTFLAETPTDSWYVKIWGETGVVGLSIHLTMLISIIFAGIVIIWRLRDERLRIKIMALHSGYIGIAFASYGNPILGQIPTGIILYISWAFLFLSPYIDQQLNAPKHAGQ